MITSETNSIDNNSNNNSHRPNSTDKKNMKRRKRERVENDDSNDYDPSLDQQRQESSQQQQLQPQPILVELDKKTNKKKKLKRKKNSQVEEDVNTDGSQNTHTIMNTAPNAAAASTVVNEKSSVVVTTIDYQQQHHHHHHHHHQHNNYKYICAPMVNASELPFRFLVRKYGTQLCYTPMLSSTELVQSEDYRTIHFASSTKIHVADHPLYIHVYCTTIQDMIAAAQMAVSLQADGLDLNLGCPQRTAYIGQYGSYMYTSNNIQSQLHIYHMLSHAVFAIQNQIPITAKIRLLHPKLIESTLNFCNILHCGRNTITETDTCSTQQQQQQQLSSVSSSLLGASLIAIHGRQRASWERTGPSARDGPADLYQIQQIIQSIHDTYNKTNTNNSKNTINQLPRLRIITNGNTTTYEDVVQNLQYTKADGIMSAEGLLDNPALFLPRYLEEDDDNDDVVIDVQHIHHESKNKVNTKEEMDYHHVYVTVWTLKEEYRYKYINYKPLLSVPMGSSRNKNKMNNNNKNDSSSTNEITVTTNSIDSNVQNDHNMDTLTNKKQSIEQKINRMKLKQKVQQQDQQPHSNDGNNNECSKYNKLEMKISKLQKKLCKVERKIVKMIKKHNNDKSSLRTIESQPAEPQNHPDNENYDKHIERKTVTYQSLHEVANDKVLLGMEYLDWATIYTTSIRTIVFHIRRMCKDVLVQYQLLQNCLSCTSIDEIRDILNRIIQYRIQPDLFIYDSQREQDEKNAIQRQKIEEGKRRAYEERMIRKAKREKKDDIFYYLNIGNQLPSKEQVEYYRTIQNDETQLMNIWKRNNHTQHCMKYHVNVGSNKCQRGSKCAFLHIDVTDNNDPNQQQIQEKDECAG